MNNRTATGPRRHAIVARFEEFLEANPGRALCLAEICLAIGASGRTLHYACEVYLGMSPIRYLLSRRMHLARRALLSADPATDTVTRIATDCGFCELGRFSVTYRSFFGETPSETLRGTAKSCRCDAQQTVSNSEHCPVDPTAPEKAMRNWPELHSALPGDPG